MKQKEPLIIVGLIALAFLYFTPHRWFPQVAVDQIRLWERRDQLEERFGGACEVIDPYQVRLGETEIHLDEHQRVRGVVGSSVQIDGTIFRAGEPASKFVTQFHGRDLQRDGSDLLICGLRVAIDHQGRMSRFVLGRPNR